ncbi:MAG: ATP-binding protein [Chloroflexota bacterium]|nr:MAG: hypothetical protein DLM70_18850 [Chloroflexota bacterium]
MREIEIEARSGGSPGLSFPMRNLSRHLVEALLAAVLNASNSGVCFVNNDGIVGYANRCLADFFGLDVGALVGVRHADVVSRSLLAQVQDPVAFAGSLERLGTHVEETTLDEVVVARPALRILERYSAPVYGDQEQLLGRVYVYADMTEVRQLDQNKDAFLSLVSHELRTPVTSIKGYAQLLQRRARTEHPSEQTMIAYATIERQTSRMQELIDMLLDVSRLESGRLRLDARDVNVSDLVGRVAEMVQMTSDAHEIALRVPAKSVWLEADEHRLEQVLVNLLANGIRYTPEGGTITLSLKEIDGAVQIAVRDEGVGISTHSLDKVFERFYRAEGVPESQGLGVGLYITRGIVERHGGSIRVESAPGRGSTFTVTLPLRLAPDYDH